MKNIILVILFVFCLFNSQHLEAQNDYYWYKNKKIYLEIKSNKKFVLLENVSDRNELKQMLNISDVDVIKFQQANILSTIKPYKQQAQKEKKWAVISFKGNKPNKISGKQKIIYEAPFYYTVQKKEAGLSHLFYVKLLNNYDLVTLEKLARENNVEILGNNKFMPLWYTLSCTKHSKGNALEMANLFYETRLFSAAEPDLMTDDLPFCVNDTHFNNQWGLNNTGQNGGTVGIDINICDAWQTTNGSSDIVVAVLDHGIELNHPDLTNMSPLSFDTESGTSPSQVLGSHGTACAGIIGANSNNNLGVAGIAADCPLMSISNSLAGTPNSRQRRADGFNFAWQNGASIISNSWGSGVQYQIIDDAIDDALTQGRNGLGWVVVFATGNNNGGGSYPANSNPDILAVGAMSPCGERKNSGSCDGENWWGGNFGNELDVVAPGVLIPTTDRQGNNGYDNGDYTQNFNGTSSACPHVAGVAALILSVNPYLSQGEVVDIIESTAQKVGGYTYQITAGRNNGTWDNEMGYGLLDAHAAVQAANPCNPPILQSISRSGTTVTFNWSNNGANNYTIGLQYSTNGGTTWVSNHGSATSPRTWAGIPDVTPIKYRVLAYSTGCSGIASNIIDVSSRSGTTGLQYSTNGGTTWVSNHGGTQSPRSMTGVPTKSAHQGVLSVNDKSKLKTVSDFTVYPNPTTGILNVQHLSGVKQLQIYDMVGKLLVSINVNSEDKTEINISALRTGIYFLHADGKFIQKIVKQ